MTLLFFLKPGARLCLRHFCIPCRLRIFIVVHLWVFFIEKLHNVLLYASTERATYHGCQCHQSHTSSWYACALLHGTKLFVRLSGRLLLQLVFVFINMLLLIMTTTLYLQAHARHSLFTLADLQQIDNKHFSRAEMSSDFVTDKSATANSAFLAKLRCFFLHIYCAARWPRKTSRQIFTAIISIANEIRSSWFSRTCICYRREPLLTSFCGGRDYFDKWEMSTGTDNRTQRYACRWVLRSLREIYTVSQ